jgi:hypothetical protein
LNESQRRVYQKQHCKEIYPEYYVIKVNQFDDLAKNTLDEWKNQSKVLTSRPWVWGKLFSERYLGLGANRISRGRFF